MTDAIWRDTSASRNRKPFNSLNKIKTYAMEFPAMTIIHALQTTAT